MAPASNEEQFKFLISCIRYSNNGKVDFGQVAKECSIVSKGAAAKRYERMMRAHGIASNAASVKPTVFRSTKIERHDSQPSSGFSSTNARKRKADQFVEDLNPADDEEGFGANFTVKVESQDCSPRFKQQIYVKEENDQKNLVHQQNQLKLEDATELLKYYSPASNGYTMTNIGQEDLYGSDEHRGENSVGSGFGSCPSDGSRGNVTGFSASPHPGRYHTHSFDYVACFDTPSIAGYDGSSGMGGMAICPAEAIDFQTLPYQVDSKGRAESPIIVEDGLARSHFKK